MEHKRKSCGRSLELHDCYAEGTNVTTSSLEKRDVRDIRVGERILGMNDKCLVVEDVISGFESEIYHIMAENGCEIRVSKDHILKKITEEFPAGKNVHARDVQAGDVMLSCDGAVRITSVQVEAYNDRVYNFAFQDEAMPNFILANGFWAGDIYAQQINMEQPNKEDMEQWAGDIQEEFKKLRNLVK